MKYQIDFSINYFEDILVILYVFCSINTLLFLYHGKLKPLTKIVANDLRRIRKNNCSPECDSDSFVNRI
jgi:hypothetical protein